MTDNKSSDDDHGNDSNKQKTKNKDHDNNSNDNDNNSNNIYDRILSISIIIVLSSSMHNSILATFSSSSARFISARCMWHKF